MSDFQIYLEENTPLVHRLLVIACHRANISRVYLEALKYRFHRSLISFSFFVSRSRNLPGFHRLSRFICRLISLSSAVPIVRERSLYNAADKQEFFFTVARSALRGTRSVSANRAPPID